MYGMTVKVSTLNRALMVAWAAALLSACGQSASISSTTVGTQTVARQGDDIPEVVVSASRTEPVRR
jgi:hypothetical protein